MNNRIKELAEESGLEFDDSLALESEPIYYVSQKDLENFAKRIVFECSEFCSQVDRDNMFKYFGV